MSIASVTPIHSPGILELNALFNNLQKPYGKAEIVRFNLAFQRIYPQLSRTERRRAEILADALITNLEDDKLALQLSCVV